MNPPRLAVPEGACDSHIHIVDPAFLPPGVDASPWRDMTPADYQRLQARLGTRRAVVVQPKAYGTDNAGTLAAIAALGAPHGADARGIAVVRPDVTEAELRRLDAGGIRGLRFSVWKASDTVTTVDMIEPLADRIRALGWHAQINMSAEQLVTHAALLERLRCPIVFDHLGRIPPPAGTGHPAFAVLSRLLRRGDVWVKLSGAYLDSVAGGPGYPDMAGLARALAALAPERAVWGSDWPHVTERHKPDDAGLLDLLLDWLPDDAARRRVLRDNPATLYGFA
ncbi:amidohydrolase family protein [Roseomonas sp. NAR14]|uniref:Amidohydrolase family protein n=1 Tax=Roseomonas acroporae TaxID=2937791 RepID=A0A9X1YCR8_9PROT|nr:amidohydrolase family protein [Roseomonas acroporae]